jgi:hypothetical protein
MALSPSSSPARGADCDVTLSLLVAGRTAGGAERPGAGRRARRTSTRDAGGAAQGHVGSGDPLTAIEDALRIFDPDLILLLFHGSAPRRHRERRLRGEVERRFGRPVAELDTSGTTTTRRSP